MDEAFHLAHRWSVNSNHCPACGRHYKIERRESRNEWRLVESGESDHSFILRDDSGECIVDIEHAEIITQQFEQWHDLDYRYTKWKLIEHDDIYVIGHFRTQGGSTLGFDSHAELSSVLAEWKKNIPSLLKRFDLDNNCTLDMREWMLARSAAQRGVAKITREAQAQPDINIICQPREGQLFLVSNLDQYKLSRRYFSGAGHSWRFSSELWVG